MALDSLVVEKEFTEYFRGICSIVHVNSFLLLSSIGIRITQNVRNVHSIKRIIEQNVVHWHFDIIALNKMAHTERYGEFVGKNVPGNKYLPIFQGGVFQIAVFTCRSRWLCLLSAALAKASGTRCRPGREGLSRISARCAPSGEERWNGAGKARLQRQKH